MRRKKLLSFGGQRLRAQRWGDLFVGVAVVANEICLSISSFVPNCEADDSLRSARRAATPVRWARGRVQGPPWVGARARTARLSERRRTLCANKLGRSSRAVPLNFKGPSERLRRFARARAHSLNLSHTNTQTHTRTHTQAERTKAGLLKWAQSSALAKHRLASVCGFCCIVVCLGV